MRIKRNKKTIRHTNNEITAGKIIHPINSREHMTRRIIFVTTMHVLKPNCSKPCEDNILFTSMMYTAHRVQHTNIKITARVAKEGIIVSKKRKLNNRIKSKQIIRMIIYTQVNNQLIKRENKELQSITYSQCFVKTAENEISQILSTQYSRRVENRKNFIMTHDKLDQEKRNREGDIKEYKNKAEEHSYRCHEMNDQINIINCPRLHITKNKHNTRKICRQIERNNKDRKRKDFYTLKTEGRRITVAG